MRIFFLEERLAGKGGTKVRKWRSNDGINWSAKIKMRMMTSHGSLSVNMYYISLELQPKVRETLLNIWHMAMTCRGGWGPPLGPVLVFSLSHESPLFSLTWTPLWDLPSSVLPPPRVFPALCLNAAKLILQHCLFRAMIFVGDKTKKGYALRNCSSLDLRTLTPRYST